MWSWLFTKWSFQLPQLWGRVTVISCSNGGVHAIAVQWTPVKWSKREHRPIIISIYLSRTDLDVEVASFVWDLKDFWPGKPVYPEAVSVDKKAVGTHSEHYVNPFWILVNIDIEHKINSNKSAGLVEKVPAWYLCTFAWCRSTPYMDSFLAFSRKFTSASAGLIPLQHKCHVWFITSFIFIPQISKTSFLIFLSAIQLN